MHFTRRGNFLVVSLIKLGTNIYLSKLSNPSSRQHLSVRIATKRSSILPPDPKASILVPQAQKNEAESLSVLPLPPSLSSSLSFFPPPPLLSFPPLSVRRLLVLSPLFPSSSSYSSFPFPACSAAKAWSKAQNGESAQESFLPWRNNSILTFPLSAFEGQFQKGIAYCFQKKKEKNGVGKDGPWSVQKRAPIICAQNIGHPKVNFSLSIFLLGHPSRRPLACREKEREREAWSSSPPVNTTPNELNSLSTDDDGGGDRSPLQSPDLLHSFSKQCKCSSSLLLPPLLFFSARRALLPPFLPPHPEFPLGDGRKRSLLLSFLPLSPPPPPPPPPPPLGAESGRAGGERLES